MPCTRPSPPPVHTLAQDGSRLCASLGSLPALRCLVLSNNARLSRLLEPGPEGSLSAFPALVSLYASSTALTWHSVDALGTLPALRCGPCFPIHHMSCDMIGLRVNSVTR
jgi:hypothetical protein